MWKELTVSAATIAFMSTSCGDNPNIPTKEHNATPSVSERIGVENTYTWLSPGGTLFNFNATNFPGTFYPEAIAEALGKYCNKPLAVPTVKVFIEPVDGINPKTFQPDPNGSRAVTIMKTERDTNKPVSLTIGVAGGRFQKLKSNDEYFYTSPHLPNNEKIITNVLSDLNASIAEEIGYHACLATVGTSLDGLNAQGESARFHKDFLRNPTVMFRPKGW